VGRQRAHPDRLGVDLVGVAHRAVDHHAGPAVLRGEDGEVAAEQRAAQRAAAVDDEDPPLPRLLDRVAHQRVVLEHLERGDRPAEGRAATEGLEHRVADLRLRVGVGEVRRGRGRLLGHGEHVIT
jgi:hypothetical protein